MIPIHQNLIELLKEMRNCWTQPCIEIAGEKSNLVINIDKHSPELLVIPEVMTPELWQKFKNQILFIHNLNLERIARERNSENSVTKI